MSALAHYLEEEGIATVAISLIRPQTDKTKPPRALWVPFELGRPLGPPSNPAFQKRVIRTALRLLEREEGPGTIDNFPDDDPRSVPDAAWRPPITSSFLSEEPNAALARWLREEIRLLAQAHQQWKARHNRTTVGLARVSIEECADFVGGMDDRCRDAKSMERSVGVDDAAFLCGRSEGILPGGWCGWRWAAIRKTAQRVVLERHSDWERNPGFEKGPAGK